MGKNKYGATKITLNNIKFDSIREAERYSELRLLERAGQIKNLELQKEYVLIPAIKIDGRVKERACKYKADFVYEENGETVVEDTKGFRTKDYIIKRKLMLFIHGIQIREI